MEILPTISGILLSLLFEYVPGFSPWYAGQTSQVKKLIMIGLLALATGGAWLASCNGPYDWVPCGDLWSLFELFITAVIVNQATYMVAKRG